MKESKFEISKVYNIRWQNISISKSEFVTKTQFLNSFYINLLVDILTADLIDRLKYIQEVVDLGSHMKLFHNIDGIICPHCANVFSKKCTLNRHIEQVIHQSSGLQVLTVQGQTVFKLPCFLDQTLKGLFTFLKIK